MRHETATEATEAGGNEKVSETIHSTRNVVEYLWNFFHINSKVDNLQRFCYEHTISVHDREIHKTS